MNTDESKVGTGRAERPRGVARRLIVVGGQCSGVGKTALIEDILRTTGEMEWTAVKVTPHAGSVPERNTAWKRRRQDGGGTKKGMSRPEDRGGVEEGLAKSALGRNGISIREEREGGGRSDTARFLAAGARRAIWVECEADRVGAALDALKKELTRSGNVIIESGSVVGYWKPDLFLMVVDPRVADNKGSARRVADQVDVFVYRSPFAGADWPDGAVGGRKGVCRILQPLGQALPRKLQGMVRQLPGRK